MSFKSTVRMILMVASAAVLGGCVVGQSVRYSEANIRLGLQGDKTVTVAVHDQRPDVLTDDEPSNWVGELRSLYGIPYDVTTDNEEPLADNMARTITSALNRRGFQATTLIVPYSLNRTAVVQRAVNNGVERIVLLTLNKYESDTYFGTSLEYDVDLTIFDGSGNAIASRSWRGDADLENISITEAFTRKIQKWFSAPEIVKAMEQPTRITTIQIQAPSKYLHQAAKRVISFAFAEAAPHIPAAEICSQT